MKTVLNFAKDAGNMINDQLILFFWLILQLFILTRVRLDRKWILLRCLYCSCLLVIFLALIDFKIVYGELRREMLEKRISSFYFTDSFCNFLS